jgi:hypothetical protein
MVQIIDAIPKQNGCLEIYFNNCEAAILNLSKKLGTVRFSCLNDDQLFRSVKANGTFISWGNALEISTSEVIQLLSQ